MTIKPAGGFRLDTELDRHWLEWALLAWLGVTAWYLYWRWGQVQWLALGDTDDNMRLMQVRALMHGQGWYDLRNYRLDPANGGYNIHWSRLVDLPIVGLILGFRPLVGQVMAERLACGLAPLLPLSIAMIGIVLTIRRLIAPYAWPIALIILMACTSTIPMFAPERIDHHGWQLAALAITVAGLADPRRVRGGATVGLSSAFSLTIGLEMLPYCAMAGAIVALRWIWDGAEARRMMAYGLTLSGATCIGFAVFASNDDMAMRCDALTPVYLTVMIAAGAFLFALGLANPKRRWLRLVLAGAAGAAIAIGFAKLFPQCLGRPEQVSPELEHLWLDNVREARPIYRHAFDVAFPIAALPVIGLIGALVATWRARRTEMAVGWAAIALFTTFAGAMLLWQVRAGPAAQMLSVPGATALVWIVVPWFLSLRMTWLRRVLGETFASISGILVRVIGSVVAFMVVSGLFTGFVSQYLPGSPANARSRQINQANAACARITSLRALDAIPAAIMFTHVDLGPRLITITHHSGVAGPYHRNEMQILDVHHAFDGPPSAFRAIAARHRAQYLLICPNLSETTVYLSRSPDGFYGQIARGRVPKWLEPVPLPQDSPFKLWRIDYAMPDPVLSARPARQAS